MPKYRVVLTAKNVDSCPLYENGDKTVVNLPEVDMSASDKVCGFVLGELLRKRIHDERNMLCELGESMVNKAEYNSEFQVPEKILRCPFVTSEVTFEISVEERIETDNIFSEFYGDEKLQELIVQLRNIPILSDVSTESFSEIIPKMKRKKYTSGEIIIRKGQRGEFFFIIHHGEVEIVQVEEDGKESVIGQLKAGECFGEMSLLTSDPVSTTIRANVETELLLVAKQDFRYLMENNPQMRLKITKLLAQRIKSTNQRMGIVVGSGMVGQLQAIGFPELIQTLAMTESTGILHVSNREAHGAIYYQMGHIIDATLEESCGEECFYAMVTWAEGTFRFEESEIQRERTIRFPDVTGLLLEAMKRLDDAHRSAAEDSPAENSMGFLDSY